MTALTLSDASIFAFQPCILQHGCVTLGQWGSRLEVHGLVSALCVIVSMSFDTCLFIDAGILSMHASTNAAVTPMLASVCTDFKSCHTRAMA
eukprot:CAMPEP_0204200994 /NCGR_PEP_ID=MMETSP0361-20130328/67138_1 /ASSEMBLY_ACC=CAM_ASM_000343 /TAXON_ID=268821 /ORGANISM="Scrippsiella Hangoei, Strain SHTV-5" /LENGTH=91 /DNA_ID=CAMNT_0051163539 /DNA_START=86 /DNA_END=358 /DNA_ORIENTATION=-